MSDRWELLQADAEEVELFASLEATRQHIEGPAAPPNRFRQVHRVLAPGGPIVMSLPHPAYAMVDPSSAHPVVVDRPYFGPIGLNRDRDPAGPPSDGTPGDHPPATDSEETPRRGARTIAAVFTSLTRAKFRVDTILEPQPERAGPRSKQWSEAMAWVPATLIIRARKEGS